MMQNNMLGKYGLTITSANHLAIMAKEIEALAAGLMEIGAPKSRIAYLREVNTAKNQMNSNAAFEEAH